MIFFTLNDAATEIKGVIDGGACKMPEIYSLINQATRRFMNRSNKPLHIRRLVRYFTYKDIITLPREVEKILHYTMDTVPAPLFSQAYEFVSHGPGDVLCPSGISGKYLEDLGNMHSTMFDVPSMEAEACGCGPGEPTYTGHNLVAFSTVAADDARGLTIVGRNNANEALGTNGLGSPLPITPWDSGVEGNFTYSQDDNMPRLLTGVRDVTWVHKPVTDGFVSLYTYNPATHQLYFLSKYHPHEVNPRYRRYRITAPDCCCGSSILAWCELGYVPQTHATDILIIQNIDALKLMVMAIKMEAEREFKLAKAYEADAYRLIEEQRNSERTHDYNLIQVSQYYGFGGISKV